MAVCSLQGNSIGRDPNCSDIGSARKENRTAAAASAALTAACGDE